MPTTRNSPTDGELGAGNTVGTPDDAATAGGTTSADQPVISEGEVSDARVDEVPETAAGVKPASAPDAEPADDEPDNDDYHKQYPGPTEEEPEDDVEALQEAEAEEEAEAGQTWAKYTGSTNHMRGLTHADQVGLGVPETQTLDNSADAQPPNLEGPALERGLWFTQHNRYRVDVSEAHPALLVYIEEDDDNFEVTRY